MSFNDFHNWCIKTIKKHPTDIAIKMISKKENKFSGEKLGMEKAEKLYYIYVDRYCVKYDFEKHDFNYTAYHAEKEKILNRKK